MKIIYKEIFAWIQTKDERNNWTDLGDLDFPNSIIWWIHLFNIDHLWKIFNIYSILEFIHIRHVFVDFFNPINQPANLIHTMLCKMKTATTNMVHRLGEKSEFHFVHHEKENVSSMCVSVPRSAFAWLANSYCFFVRIICIIWVFGLTRRFPFRHSYEIVLRTIEWMITRTIPRNVIIRKRKKPRRNYAYTHKYNVNRKIQFKHRWTANIKQFLCTNDAWFYWILIDFFSSYHSVTVDYGTSVPVKNVIAFLFRWKCSEQIRNLYSIQFEYIKQGHTIAINNKQAPKAKGKNTTLHDTFSWLLIQFPSAKKMYRTISEGSHESHGLRHESWWNIPYIQACKSSVCNIFANR